MTDLTAVFLELPPNIPPLKPEVSEGNAQPLSPVASARPTTTGNNRARFLADPALLGDCHKALCRTLCAFGRKSCVTVTLSIFNGCALNQRPKNGGRLMPDELQH